MRVSNKNFENVKPFVLDHLSIISKKVHAYLEVFSTINVSSHDTIVGAVQKYLAQEFYGLALSDIAVGLYQNIVVFFEEKVEVDREIPGNKVFMSCEELLGRDVLAMLPNNFPQRSPHSKGSKCVSCHLE